MALLPENFSIPTNTGLHGDMQFFEVSVDHQMTASEPKFHADSETYDYHCYDSDEGCVTIIHTTVSGDDAQSADADELWDVEIRTGSDVWGLEETGNAVRDAIRLHKALGRDKQRSE